MKSLPAYLYCIRVNGTDDAKIGVTQNPKARIGSLATCLPQSLSVIRVIRFATVDQAKHWEAKILATSKRSRDRGEWVTFCDDLVEAMASIREGEDAAHLVAGIGFGRVTPSLAEPKIAKRSPVYAKAAESFAYQRRFIHKALAGGFGAEDCQHKHGVPIQVFRAEVMRLRKNGNLLTVMGLEPGEIGAA